MTPVGRTVAVLVGLAGLVLALSAALREIVLASDVSVTWRGSAALSRLVTDPWWATWAAAAGTAALAVALVALTVRQLSPADGGPQLIQFRDEAGWARLDVRAMERGMRRRLQASLPGVTVREVRLRKDGDSWRVTVGADVPARDLHALRTRMQVLAGDDLLRTGGMRLGRLDLVALRLQA